MNLRRARTGPLVLDERGLGLGSLPPGADCDDDRGVTAARLRRWH